jgi:malonate-semialdehyde dehydrogenase (acetylating) / methylmalonate-semialdehyde dehydrogenase
VFITATLQCVRCRTGTRYQPVIGVPLCSIHFFNIVTIEIDMRITMMSKVFVRNMQVVRYGVFNIRSISFVANRSGRRSLSTSDDTPRPIPTVHSPWIDDTTITQNGTSANVYKYWSDNKFITSTAATTSNDITLKVRNPSTQELVASVPENSEDELNEIVLKSKQAQLEWRSVPVQQRQRIMFRYQALIRDRIDDLAALITLENGKTIADAVGDIIRGVEVIETSCQIASQLLGHSLMGISTTMDTISYRQPLGICAGICPFNFPAMIPLWMFPLAITAGNTFILKPSEQTPGCALLLAQLTAEAGLPPNVLQIVHGAHATVQRLCTHNDIAALSFVGGNVAGAYIQETGCKHGKRVQANLGAKNHAVILPDANRTAVIRAITGAAFGAAGQRCMALSVVILVGETEGWCDDIVAAAKGLNVGAGWEPNTDVGPLVSKAARDRVEIAISKSVMQGAELLLDGRGVVVPNYPDGNFVGPTVIKVSASDRTENEAYTQEIFGPVLTILTADNLDDAMNIINSNMYGNGVALFTQSGASARHFTANINCGQVGINVPIPVPLPMFSFTGNKASIRGDINFYGASGVQFYTQLKTVTSNWPYEPRNADFGGVLMPTMGAKK